MHEALTLPPRAGPAAKRPAHLRSKLSKMRRMMSLRAASWASSAAAMSAARRFTSSV